MQKWNGIQRNLEKKYGKTLSSVLFSFIVVITKIHHTISSCDLEAPCFSLDLNQFIIK